MLKSFFLRSIAATLAFTVIFFTTATSYSLAQNYSEKEPRADIEIVYNQVTFNENEEGTLQEEFTEYLNPSLEFTPNAIPIALPWIGMGLGKLLGWLAVGSIGVATVMIAGIEVANVIDFAKELAKSTKKDKPRYFKAMSVNNSIGLYVYDPLTDNEAYEYLLKRSSNEVWTPNEQDAKSLAMRVGQGRFTEKENHHLSGYNDTRYFWHYHGGDSRSVYRSGHIFFGTSSFMGKNKR